jgi:predicted Zn-dependent peptidase
VCNAERSYVLISGLSDNMTKAVNLFETLVKDAVVDNDVFNDYVASLLKNREDLRANQSSNFEALNRYVAWGPEYVKKTGVTNERLKSMTADELLAGLRHMLGMKHRIIYYGPEQMDKVVADLNNCHMKGVTLSDPDEFTYYTAVETPETVIYIAPYDAKQLYMRMFSNDGEKFDVKKHSGISMYNEYFGGGMNSIVFQEMREARSLAYSAIGFYSEPSDLRDDAAYYAQIATQNDKLMDAIAAFNEIIENMPESEPAFELAKSAIDSQLRTARVLDDNIAWSYINAVDRGIAPSLDGDGKNKSAGVSLNRTLFEALPYMTLEDVVKFQQENVKGRKYHIGILGKIEDLDLDALGKLGKVVILSTDDIFGY